MLSASSICWTNCGPTIPMTDLCEQIAGLLRSESRFLVLTHYRPDGDAVGSQLALFILLKDLGKQVEAWNDDEVPSKFRFLPQSAVVTRPPAAPKDFDVVIAIDTSNWQRVGTAAQRIGKKKHLVNIDHHISNDKFGDINWIVPEAPASGQIAYDLIKRGGFKLTREIATCLFAAISTDTGSFTYANTSADCLRVAAELVQTGINVGEVCRHIYESYPYARLQLLQMALADIKLTHNKRVAYYWVTNEMYEESGAKREDTEGLIDYARSIEGVYVAVLFEEQPEPGKVRISLRSKHPKVDVNSIARRFGGGGHREAAGARISGETHEIEAKVLAAIDTALNDAGL
jgi:phosphoesterase RecJ-like protein